MVQNCISDPNLAKNLLLISCGDILLWFRYSLDRKKYSRKCKNGGVWNQSQAKIECKIDGKIHKHDCFLFAIKVKYDNPLQTINQLNETVKILQSIIATKNGTITALKQAINERSNVNNSPAVPKLVFFVPSSDELNQQQGRVVKFRKNPYYFKFRRN